MRRTRMRFALALAASLVAAVGMTSREHAAEAQTWLLSTSFSDFGGCVDCWICDPGHGAADHGDPLSQYAEGHGLHSCSGWTSCFEHGVCGGEFASAERLNALRGRLDDMRKAILARDAETLRGVLDPTGNPRIVWVQERAAIQVIGCGERVLIHLPISSSINLGELRSTESLQHP